MGLPIDLSFAVACRRTVTILMTGLALFALSGVSHAGDLIYYGSRAGMQYTVSSSSGLGTAEAVIQARHTRKNATAYCRDYVQSVTKACIAENLAEVPARVTLRGNCETGEFTGFDAERYLFDGASEPAAGEDPSDMMAEYRILRTPDEEPLDGSSASGYDVALGIYQALCPGYTGN